MDLNVKIDWFFTNRYQQHVQAKEPYGLVVEIKEYYEILSDKDRELFRKLLVRYFNKTEDATRIELLLSVFSAIEIPEATDSLISKLSRLDISLKEMAIIAIANTNTEKAYGFLKEAAVLSTSKDGIEHQKISVAAVRQLIRFDKELSVELLFRILKKKYQNFIKEQTIFGFIEANSVSLNKLILLELSKNSKIFKRNFIRITTNAVERFQLIDRSVSNEFIEHVKAVSVRGDTH